MKKYDEEGYIKVSETCQLWFGVRGQGMPIVFLHGGPGTGSQKYFETNTDLFLSSEIDYQLIEFDQRGCGQSKPSIYDCYHKKEVREQFKNIHIDELAEDIEKLRKYLNIRKWIVFGGSWGSTLGIRYAQLYPDSISGLILRSIFLGSKDELNEFYSYDGRVNDLNGTKQLEKIYSILNCDDSNDAIELLSNASKRILGGEQFVAISIALDEKNYMNSESKTLEDLTESEQKSLTSFGYHVTLLPLNMNISDAKIDLLSPPNGKFPIWVIQGVQDNICPSKYADLLVEKLKKTDREVKYLKIKDGKHEGDKGPLFQAIKSAVHDISKLVKF